MKQIILFKILEKFKEKPELMRKAKIFAVVGVVVLLLTGALMVWAGVSAFNYVASSVNQAIQSPIAQGHVENLKTELKNLPKQQAINCWGKAQSLLAVQPWLERPALDNLANLKIACFGQKPACQGTDCDQINTNEGSLYDSN